MNGRPFRVKAWSLFICTGISSWLSNNGMGTARHGTARRLGENNAWAWIAGHDVALAMWASCLQICIECGTTSRFTMKGE